MPAEQRAILRRLRQTLSVGIVAGVVLVLGWAMLGSPVLTGISTSYLACSLILLGWAGLSPGSAAQIEGWSLRVGLVHLAACAVTSGCTHSPLMPFALVIPVVGAASEGMDRAIAWVVACGAFVLALFVLEPFAPGMQLVVAPPWMRAVGWMLSLAMIGYIALNARWNADILRVELAEARDEALASADARTRFLARTSHEIRTPLHGVLGMSEILQRTELGAHQRELVDGILGSGRGLLTVVDQVLDLTKLEADRVEIHTRPFDAVAAVEDVLTLYAVPAQLAGTRVVSVVAPGFPAWLIGDGGRVRQVLGNLVHNAVKFTREGVVCVRVVHGDGALRITVEDTGIGLSEDEIARLFRPYRQANRETSVRYGGTGLGLSVARRLAQRMGGDLSAVGEPGRGATFELVLPLAVAEPAQPGPLLGRSLAVLDPWEAPSSMVTAGRLLGMRVIRPDPRRLSEVEDDVDWVAVAVNPELAGMLAAARARWPRARTCLVVPLADAVSRIDAGRQGFHAVLTEPVRRAALQDLVLADISSDDPVPVAVQQALDGPSVLVVDDNPVNRRVAELMLQRLGARVTTVASGEAALEANERERFDLVVMDVLMPGISGIEATRRLRALSIPQPRVVALSASVLEEQREACFEAGVDAFLRKPLTLDALADVLRGGPSDPADDGGP